MALTVEEESPADRKQFSYDRQGGIIEEKNAAGIRLFSYNSRHQQTRVETETGSVQENRYDAEGLRFELLENGRRTSFVYHDGELLHEEGREEQEISYHLGAGIEAFRRGQELYYYHRDEQLSTALVTDGQGEIRNSYQYDAFGIPLETTEQLNNRIRYTGQQYDELTEQYYLRARYYNPVAGRFMQEDVYQGDGLNLYAYCGNNPVVYDDPSGYERKACPPKGKISESVDETSYGKSSSNCTELVPYYPANNGAESGKTSNGLPDWLKARFEAGNSFNKENRPRYPYNEVEVYGDGKNYVVDSYIPGSEIVSRKFTQLASVKESTGIGYLNELQKKYPSGAIITDSPFNPKVLRGKTMTGNLNLEIPEQKGPIPQSVIDYANNKGIIIRDVNGKEYN